MKKEIVKQEKIDFTTDQIALIKSHIAPKATDNELALFLHQAKKSGLDPLARQIYCIPIGGKMSIQTSIDGFRVVAERSGNYAGQGEPEFIENEKGIICCKVRVFKFSDTGERYEASVGVAYWKEYAQSSPMWTKMPHNMISKCAEALALRKAFPQDLSGLYTSDEMAQSEIKAQDIEHEEVKSNGHEPIDFETWKIVIEECKSEQELVKLYKANKATIDSSKELQSLFTDHKNNLRHATA